MAFGETFEPKAELARCNDCSLAHNRFIPTEHNETTHIFMIGEAGGYEEERTGKPFVGKAGQLLFQTLLTHGIRRRNCVVTNAVLCRPDDNRTPSAQEIRCCRERLYKELHDTDMIVVLALGNVAVESLFQEKIGVMSIRGKAYLTDIALNGTTKEVLILPTVHPAAVLRVPSMYDEFRRDLGKLRTLIQKHEEGRPRMVTGFQAPEVIECETVDQLLAEIDGLMQFETVTADLETTGFDPLTADVLCLSMSGDRQRGIIVDREQFKDSRVQEKLRALFDKVGMANHNCKFDAKHMINKGVSITFKHDTMLAHYMLDERKGTHGLKDLSAEYLSAPDYEGEIKQYLKKRTDSYEVIPRPVLHKYAGWDGVLTARLLDKVLPAMNLEGKVRWVYDNIMMPASSVFTNVELHGFRVDIDVRNRLREQYTHKIDVLLQQIRTTSNGLITNPSSTQQVASVLSSYLNRTTASGNQLATDKEALEEIKHLHPVASMVLDYRHLVKMKSTYIDGIQIDTQGYTHPDFLQHGTTTGRVVAINPPILTIPRESLIRNQFCASEGCILLQADYSQAELRDLAHLSQDPVFLKIFFDGRDPHDEVVKMIYAERVLNASKELLKEYRIHAKAINFGIAYGITEFGLSANTGWSIKEAKIYLQRYFDELAVLKKWMDAQYEQARSTGIIESPFGRRRRFHLITRELDDEIRKASVNAPTQSCASDITLLAAIELAPKLKGKADIVNVIYDALVFDVKLQYLDEVAPLIKETMESIPRRFLNMEIPYPVDLETGDHWGSLKKYERAT